MLHTESSYNAGTQYKRPNSEQIQYGDYSGIPRPHGLGTRRKDKLNPKLLMALPASFMWLLFGSGGINENGLNSSLELKFVARSSYEFTGLFAPQIVEGNLDKLIEALGSLTKEQYTRARGSVNPFELIKSSIFVNRSAIKLANIDVFCGILEPVDGKFVFADLCAGPGGFSSYLIWRARQMNIDIHGYCITLSSEIDIDPSVVAEYGSCLSITNGTRGDITSNENIKRFCDSVALDTNGSGVDLVTADGSASFDRWETNKEGFTFRICLCEVIAMLNVLKPDGTFVMKVFDIHKEFTVCLIWILRNIFRKLAVFKPQTSRPASLERFIVCKGYIKPDSGTLYNHLLRVNEELNGKGGVPGRDFSVILTDLEKIAKDKEFVSYIHNSNCELCATYNMAVRKINYARCNNASIGTMYNHALIAKNWLKILSLPPSPGTF